MRTRELDEIEVRVLGALLEKEQTTPDYYPMTVNSLLAAANQKTNRDPVTALGEEEVIDALDRLRRDVLVWRSEGARVEKWSQSISRRLELDAAGKALLTLLMLRGPQTPGELRARSGRLHAFGDNADVVVTLNGLIEREAGPLLVKLPKTPGRRDAEYMHLFSGPIDVDEYASQARASKQSAPAGRTSMTELEERVSRLEAEVASLKERLG